MSQAKLIHDLGVELVRQGHAVVVAAPAEGARAPFELAEEDGLSVLRVKGPKLKGIPKVLRAVHEERLSARMWRGGRAFFESQRFDLVVYYSPTIFFGRLVARLKRRWGCPAYLVLRDIFPQWAVDAGILRKGLVWRFFRHRELQQYAAADVIAVQSARNLEYFREELPGRRYTLEVLYNWSPIDEGELPRSDLRARLGLTDEVVFFYGGNIGVAQEMDNILDLARSFPPEARVAFVLVGEGSEVPRLKARVESEGIHRVRILSAVGQREYLAMLREVDVGLISLDRKLRTHNFPGKMLGYMQAGLPILASLNPGNDLADVLDDHQAGLWSLSGQHDELRERALRLAGDADLRRRIGANARALLLAKFSAAAAARQVVARWSEEPGAPGGS
jgi:glycosyltransferase involved in cell wall biosynthesis